MTYRVEIERQAAKGLRRIDAKQRRRIEDRIQALANDPRPTGAIKLTGVDGYRIRVGDYRVVYTISDQTVTVTVVRVGHRKSIYREV
ncbi:MAG TPA: type II toxin-antitoxin system RelE/ParE family toxin [Jiangellaceae bacterium]|nr:type II toxin-antitoxin system RelE/ParE family toxin [Jiangellaceae bacterium]